MLDAHRAELEYDWRTRFHAPLSDVGTERMPWGEAVRLVDLLSADPSAQLGSVLAGWDHPTERLDLVVRDLYDLTHHVAWAQAGGKGGKPAPYPRPWPRVTHRTQPDQSLTQSEIIAALREAGHTAELPGIS